MEQPKLCFSQRSLQLSLPLQYSHPPCRLRLHSSLTFISPSINLSSKMKNPIYLILSQEERGWHWSSLFPFTAGFPGPLLCNGSSAVCMERVAECRLGLAWSSNDIQGTKLSHGKKIKFLVFCFVLASREHSVLGALRADALTYSHFTESRNQLAWKRPLRSLSSTDKELGWI